MALSEKSAIMQMTRVTRAAFDDDARYRIVLR